MKITTITIQGSEVKSKNNVSDDYTVCIYSGEITVGAIKKAVIEQLYRGREDPANMAIILNKKEQKDDKILTTEEIENSRLYFKEAVRFAYAPNTDRIAYFFPATPAQEIKSFFLGVFGLPIKNIQLFTIMHGKLHSMEDELSLMDVLASAKTDPGYDGIIRATTTSNVCIADSRSPTGNSSNTSMAQTAGNPSYHDLTFTLLLPDRSTKKYTIQVRYADTVLDIKQQIQKEVNYPVEQISISKHPGFSTECHDTTTFGRLYWGKHNSKDTLTIFLKKPVTFIFNGRRIDMYFPAFVSLSTVQEQLAEKTGVLSCGLRFFITEKNQMMELQEHDLRRFILNQQDRVITVHQTVKELSLIPTAVATQQPQQSISNIRNNLEICYSGGSILSGSRQFITTVLYAPDNTINDAVIKYCEAHKLERDNIVVYINGAAIDATEFSQKIWTIPVGEATAQINIDIDLKKEDQHYKRQVKQQKKSSLFDMDCINQ